MFGLKVHKFIHLLITSLCCVCMFVAIILIPHNRFATWVPVVCVPVIGISWLILSLRIRALNTRAEDANYRNCPFCDYETVANDSGHLCPECGAAFKQGELRRTWLNKVRWLLGEQVPMDQWRTAIPPQTIELKPPNKSPNKLPEWTSTLNLEQVGQRCTWTFIGAVAVTVLILLLSLPRLLILIAFIPWIICFWNRHRYRRALRERIFEYGDLACPHCMHALANQRDHLRCFECGFHCQPKELQPLWEMKLRGNTPDPITSFPG